MDEAAGIGLNAEGVKVISADQIWPDDYRVASTGVEADAADDVVGDELVETMVLVAEVAVIGIGLRGRGVGVEDALNHVEVIGVRDVERAQDERVEHAEDDGVGSDGECKGEYGGEGEAGGFQQLEESH